jgi:homoserine kinase
MAQEVHIFAPATVANVACGFDSLGFAIQRPGDEVVARFSDGHKGLVISGITGDQGTLSRKIEENTASVAAQAVLDHLGVDRGIDMVIHKGLPIGSGLGSSAASAVGGAMAINELLDRPLTKKELLPFALQGEALASGGAIHADNVGPCLLGGIELIRSNKDLDTVNIPPPDILYAAVVLPNIQILTKDARAVLRKEIPMHDAITQWGNMGAMIAGLLKHDYKLIGRSLVDVIAERYRASLIPGFFDVKQAAIDAGALGCSISGAGLGLFIHFFEIR